MIVNWSHFLKNRIVLLVYYWLYFSLNSHIYFVSINDHFQNSCFFSICTEQSLMYRNKIIGIKIKFFKWLCLLYVYFELIIWIIV